MRFVSKFLQPTPVNVKDLRRYALDVVSSGIIKHVYLIGSQAVRGIGNDIDLLYDFGTVDLSRYQQYEGETEEELLEHLVETTNIDSENYDSFYRVNGKYFHLSCGAGRCIMENTEYANEQKGKPVVVLAGKKKQGRITGNTAVWNGRPFVVGAASILDGHIEEVHSYEEMEDAGWHHTFAFSRNILGREHREKDDDPEQDILIFWIEPNGQVASIYDVPPGVAGTIEKQIKIPSKR